MNERKYLPTIGELDDRMIIDLLKSIFIDRKKYLEHLNLIGFDLEANYQEKFSSGEIHIEDYTYNLIVLTIANFYIWVNESKARRTGKGGLLRATHSINGVRNRAKNEINKLFGERTDDKIDCLAADLPEEFGNWRLWDEG
jgi:hypothetical protein